MPTARPDTYDIASGADLWAGVDRPDAPLTMADIANDAAWSWFSTPQAIYRNGASFVGHNTSVGSPTVTKLVHAGRSVSQFTLSAALQVDDHCVPSIAFWPDGTLQAAYSKLVDTVLRLRRTTSAEDISAWGSEQTVSTPGSVATTYASARHLSGPGRMLVFTRIHAATGRINCYTHSADGASWSSMVEFYRGASGSRPYMRHCKRGTDGVHFACTDMHPDSGQSSVYHFRGVWDAGTTALKFYTTAGVEITDSKPFLPASITQVYSGASAKAWICDIAVGADGHPRVLFTTYPNNNGTDIRIMFSRWDGDEWTAAVDVVGASVGTSLYGAEPYYTGLAVFDQEDPDLIHLSAEALVTGRYDVQRRRTDDNGATWALLQTVTSAASGQDAIRPVSPEGHNGELPMVCLEGTYTSYTSYSMKLRGGFA